ncbi:tyrosine protein kinase [Paenibacillus sp. Leaf72]|uniref:tyrosine protein kinase n=1 Tax=Paenibacillus sp. Leaf72 TaxID=1736234 RepID=UPI0012DD921A|nr:tyrosine protein kinase [Paenibacillus sp. Leaf72]
MNYRNNPGGYPQYPRYPHAQQPQHFQHRSSRQGQSQLSPAVNHNASVSGLLNENAIPEFQPPLQSVQAVQPESQTIVPATAAELAETVAPAKGGGFSLANLGEIKGFVDRIGGIDGILTTVTKVQKVMSSVSQMAPLVKVIMGSFGKKGAGDDATDDVEEFVPKRKRRKSGSGSGSSPAARRRRRKRRR